MKLLEKVRKRSRDLLPFLLATPALLLLLLIIVLPAIRTVFMSFHRVTFGLPEQYVGLSNYTNIFTDPLFQISLGNTFLFSFSVVIGQLAVGLLAATVMSTRFKYQKIYVSILMMPYAVSVVVAIIVWKYMLHTDIGLINYLFNGLLGVGKIEWASNAVHAWIALIVIRIWMRFPFSFLIIYSSFLSIPEELYESAHLDGASNLQSFRYITLPYITPGLMVAGVFAFVFAFRNFGTVWILTGGGPSHATELLSTLLYQQAFSFWEFGAASTIAIVMTIITFIVALYYLKTMYKRLFAQ